MYLLTLFLVLNYGSPAIYDIAFETYFMNSEGMFVHGFDSAPVIVQWLLSPQIHRELTSMDANRRVHVLQLLNVYKDPYDKRLLE